LRAYTWGSAFAASQEKERGTLAAGYLGDCVVLSRDILDAASEKPTAPARAEMEADVARYAMQPLFVPGVSDTI